MKFLQRVSNRVARNSDYFKRCRDHRWQNRKNTSWSASAGSTVFKSAYNKLCRLFFKCGLYCIISINMEIDCMRRFIAYLLVVSCFWSAHSFAVAKTPWDGDFTIELFGEKLIDGSQVFLQYDFTINSENNHASLSMTTWHAPITCIGDYSVKVKSDVLELYHLGIEKNSCPYPSPQFEISRKGNDYYIKGRQFSYSSPDEWLPLRRITPKQLHLLETNDEK